MKTKIDRMKHSQHFTKRTLALAMCFVMLFSAIGAGSVMTAIAQAVAPSANTQPAADTQQTDDGDATAADVSVPAEGDSSNSSGAEGNSFFKTLSDQITENSNTLTLDPVTVDEEDEEEGILAPKEDLDLAATGYNGDIAFAADFNSWSDSANTATLNNNSADITINNISAGLHEFKLVVEGQWWGCNSTGTMNATINSSWNLNSNNNANNVGLNVTTAGSYTFHVSYSNGSWTITVTSVPSGGGGSDPEMVIYGDFNGTNDWNSAGNRKMTYMGSNSSGYNYFTYTLNSGADAFFKFHDTTNDVWWQANQNSDLEVTSNRSSPTWGSSSNSGAFKVSSPSVQTVIWVYCKSDTFRIWKAPTTAFYLTGYVNGSDTGNAATRPFTYSSGNNWTCTLNSTTSTQYVTIWDGVSAYHPETHASGTGIAADPTKTDGTANNDNKWFVSGAFGKSVTFTWNALTNVLSWEIGKDNVTVYAKDGAAPINWDSKSEAGATGLEGFGSPTKYYYNFAAIAKTTMTYSDGSSIDGKTTTVCDINNAAAYAHDSEYETATITAGTTIKITTTIDDYNSWRSKYYVKGWCINGVTYKCGSNVKGVNSGASDGSSGAYTMYYTIPANAASNAKFEITPIYYRQDNSNCITFYLEGFDKTMQEENGWGNTPYAFPFYGNIFGYQDSFGVYPGQPMVYVDGKYSMEVPITSKAIYDTGNENTTIKGVTVSNGYADHVHRNVIYDWTTGTDAGDDFTHMQTYDFDDFYKIYNEKRDSQGNRPNAIILRLKRETTSYNRNVYGDANNGINWFFTKNDPEATINNTTVNTIATSGNGWELLTDRYGRPVDLFGNVISTSYSSSDEQSKPAIRVISTGYNETISGDYGTAWLVYTPTASSGYTSTVNNADGTSGGYTGSSGYTLQTASNERKAVPPSVFLLASESSFNNTTYPGVNNRTFDGVTYSDYITNYKTLYQTLKNSGNDGSDALGRYVYITYESNQQRKGQNSTTDGDYGAKRMDARWYYTYATDMVSADIKIQYWNGSAYVDEASYVSGYNNKANKGDHTGCMAYFTNAAFDGERESGDVLINSGDFEFTAKTTTGWVFDSWQIEYDGGTYTELSNKSTASTPMSAKDTLVARFKPVTEGYLNLSHHLSADTTGSGTTEIRVQVYSSDAKTDLLYDTGFTTDDVTLDTDYINNALKDAYIQVTLKTTPTGDDNFVNMTCTDSAHFGGVITKENTNPYTFGFKVRTLFDSNVTTQTTTSVQYFSKITIQDHYYTINYTYPKRGEANNAGTGSYTVDGKFTAKEYETYVSGNHVLSGAFIKAKAPFESNFNKNMTLSYSDSYPSAYAGDPNYRFTVNVSYTQTDALDNYAIFDLPYAYYTTTGTAGDVGYKKYTAKPEESGANEGKIIEKDDSPTVEIDTQYNKFFTSTGEQNNVSKVTDASDVNHTGNDFITAPELIYDSTGSTIKYFCYWSVNNVGNTEELFRVYYPDFNYRACGNYYVIPVYDNNEANYWHNNYVDSGNTASASILYLGSSRNQWNSSTSQTNNTSTSTASDLIYNDFMLSYTYKGQEITSSSDVLDCGMIIELVPTTKSGNTYAEGDASSADTAVYKAMYDSTIPDNITLDGIVNSGSSGNYIRVNTTNALAGGPAIKAGLDNKNRMEFYYSFYAKYGQNGFDFFKDPATDKYVFRAYAYIKDANGISYSSPAYFCMRYTANR